MITLSYVVGERAESETGHNNNNNNNNVEVYNPIRISDSHFMRFWSETVDDDGFGVPS